MAQSGREAGVCPATEVPQALAADTDVGWASIATLEPPRSALEELFQKAMEEEDHVRADAREQRRQG